MLDKDEEAMAVQDCLLAGNNMLTVAMHNIENIKDQCI